MSNSTQEEGNKSLKSMENGNGHHILQLQAPPVPEKQRTQNKTPNYSYNECQKNHAAVMGVNSRDGCGEFMAGGEEGTLEALNCAACNCHRNFHRREVIEEDDDDGDHDMVVPEPMGYPANIAAMVPSATEGMIRKRSRTKFTKEQKVKMYDFAVRGGWKLQKMEDDVVEHFCQEVGINRKVLKVWMQNNKHAHLGINRNNNNGINNNSSSSNQL